MSAGFLGWLAHAITTTIAASGYLGVFFLMAAESANLPIPSEVIMPFSGSLIASGQFAFLPVILAGTAGNLAGSLLSYAVARFGGRPFLDTYGRWLFISRDHLGLADRWFERYGLGAVFWGRLLPIVRTFISFPAGLAGLPIGSFSLVTFIGALPFVSLLTWIGYLLGQNWDAIRPYFRNLDAGILALIILYIAWRIVRRRRARNLGRS